MGNPEHVDRIRQGVISWNDWRLLNPGTKPDLWAVDLSGQTLSHADFRGGNLAHARFPHYLEGAQFDHADLRGANFVGASLIGASFEEADLRGANMMGANLFGANLRKAKLGEAKLIGANLSTMTTNVSQAPFAGGRLFSFPESRCDLEDADLTGADFTMANLSDARFAGATLVGADLSKAVLVGTEFRRADLSCCRVHGVSAWDLKLDQTTRQFDLVITPRNEPDITVDDLEVAQFVYLMLRSDKIRRALTIIGEKGVLILGRFTPERKEVLDAIRQKLRELDFVPMMFDFKRVDDRSFTETIKTLAGMSKFIIADVTNPKSSPLELQATVPDYMVPFVPIIEAGEKPFSMLADLQQREWVTAVKEYRDVDNLIDKLESRVVRPALELHAKLRLKKARAIQIEALHN